MNAALRYRAMGDEAGPPQAHQFFCLLPAHRANCIKRSNRTGGYVCYNLAAALDHCRSFCCPPQLVFVGVTPIAFLFCHLLSSVLASNFVLRRVQALIKTPCDRRVRGGDSPSNSANAVTRQPMSPPAGVTSPLCSRALLLSVSCSLSEDRRRNFLRNRPIYSSHNKTFFRPPNVGHEA